MTFTAEAWARNEAAYETIRTMPFNAELAAGSLSRERFQNYIVQDAHYLIGYGRALAILAAKAPDPDRIVQFAGAASEAIVVERALHGSFFSDWGITEDAFLESPVAPTTHHYVSFLISTCYGASYPVGVAALLPCFWIYAEVGRDIHARAAANNPYRAWIDTYAGHEFHDAVRGVVAATDEAAATASPTERVAMHHAYTRSTQLEWMFWDGAYRREIWPV
ncbi:MAG: TenA family protein [Devosia sp.]